MDYLYTIRHFLTVLAMRLQHAVMNAPEGFDSFDPGHGIRSPRKILEHCVGMTVNVRHIYVGKEIEVHDSNPWEDMTWEELISEFHDALHDLDEAIEEHQPPSQQVLFRLFQGPLCDAMTHIGQMIMIRRIMNAPVENVPYWKLDLKVGRVDGDQPME
jgi:hypothetical protein